MKKLILATAVAAILAAPAASARDRITVEHQGQKERFYVESLKETSVCSFKRQVAQEFDLKMKKFDLKRAGIKLHEDKTLYASNVRTSSTVMVIPVSSSFQC